MSNQAQNATDQQYPQLLQRSLDLIVGEWLCSSTVTTLAEPKLCLVRSCIIAMRDSRKRSLQIQMYGSGSLLIPRFTFDSTTTVAELFWAVQEQVPPVGPRAHGVCRVDRLIFGGDEEVILTRQEASRCIASYDIADNAIGFVVMMDGTKILAKLRQWTARPALTLSVVELDLSRQVTGRLPSEIGQCCELESLQCEGSDLYGSIPTEVGQCSQLIRLFLRNNQLTGSCDFVIVLIDGKRVYQLTEMRWQVVFPAKLGSALSLHTFRSTKMRW